MVPANLIAARLSIPCHSFYQVIANNSQADGGFVPAASSGSPAEGKHVFCGDHVIAKVTDRVERGSTLI